MPMMNMRHLYISESDAMGRARSWGNGLVNIGPWTMLQKRFDPGEMVWARSDTVAMVWAGSDPEAMI